MDIKGIARNFWPMEIAKAKGKADEVKPQSSTDRDANGQQQQQPPERRKLSDDEFKSAIEYLEQLTGVRDNHLTIRVEVQSEMRIVFIEDPQGKVIRRIPEIDLLQLLRNRQKSKGQIFDKAM